MSLSPNVRAALRTDVPRLVAIHMEGLGGALTSLGPQVVARYYDRGLVRNDGLLLVADLPDLGVVGLAELDLEDVGLLGRFRLRDGFVLTGSALRRPSTAVRLLRRRNDGFAVPSPRAAFLRFFAVEGHARGRGIGTALLEVAAGAAEAAGHDTIETATTNSRLIAHYVRRFDATVVRSWPGDGPDSTLLRIPLPLRTAGPEGMDAR